MKEKEQLQKKFGKHLKAVMREKNITVAELSRLTFFDQPNVSRLVNGATCPNLYTLLIICKALDITIEEFFEGFDK